MISLAKHFIRVIIGEAKTIPGTLRIFNNDIVALLKTYEGNITYEQLGFAPDEITAWKANAIAPQQAADWKAHRISPADAMKWLMTNSPFAYSANTAAAWHIEGFTPEDFSSWAERGIRPYIARLWIDAGYNAEKANELTNQGYLTPEGNAR